MGSARQDYERFVRWLHEPHRQASEDALRFANLVLTNFDAIAETSRQHNQRSMLLAELARNSLANSSPDIPELAVATPEGEWPWRRLRNLTLGPFRGFPVAQPFDLRKRLVLFYGPNGSGKSSLCEALEYALLGEVEEADLKRIETEQYLTNIYAGRSASPILTATDADNREIDVQANADLFRFCFVEKNRIDAFSRISARPTGRRAELIATLFGMDQFNDFASHFNEAMDQALVLGNTSQGLLASRRLTLAADQAVTAGEAAQLDRIDHGAAQHAEAFEVGCTYEALKALVTKSEPACRLQQIEEQLNAVPPRLVGITRASVEQLYLETASASKNASASARKLEEFRSQVSFRDLYNAVLVLRIDDPDHCPACGTPMTEVVQNPFDKADAGLQELREIAELQEDDRGIRGVLEEANRALREGLAKLHTFLDAQGEGDGPVATYLGALPPRPEAPEWWIGVYSPESDATGLTPSLDQVLSAADRAGKQDERSTAALGERQRLIGERDRLNEVRLWIQKLELNRQRVVDDAAAARARIERFEVDNEDLINRANQEADDNTRDRPIKEAYERFMPLLRRFRNELPGMLMANLNQAALELYNEFNQADRDEDKLAALRLPLTGEARIDIAFRGAPAQHVDALAVLSEGHIRCLGLAILLAKAISVRSPVVIFDDAINAIDHDHRSGIRSAIFESDRFQQTQIVVTCHSPEFIKDIQNYLPQPQRAECQEYVLLHHEGDHQPRVHPDVGSSNYLARARESLARLDARDSLSYCRKALEMLATKSWKWLESHRVGDLSVQVDGPGKEPQLRNLCDALRRKLNGSATFTHPSKQPLIDSLNMILGIPSANLVWTYLNKGTHEEADRDDFDREHVSTVLRALEAIDALELRPNR